MAPRIDKRDHPYADKLYIPASAIPTRRPSDLPPSPQLQLSATIGAFLGDGRTSVVVALDNVVVPGLASDVILPPLVAKIARPHRVSWAAREAWFYDEMECLQGSVVPYCFGYFERDMGYDMNTEGGSQHYVKAFQNYPPKGRTGSDEEVLHMLSDGTHPMLEDRVRRRDILAITVMERLGDMLPWGVKVDDSTK